MGMRTESSFATSSCLSLVEWHCASASTKSDTHSAMEKCSNNLRMRAKVLSMGTKTQTRISRKLKQVGTRFPKRWCRVPRSSANTS
eukprot:2748286-Amphidinium_carterae.1